MSLDRTPQAAGVSSQYPSRWWINCLPRPPLSWIHSVLRSSVMPSMVPSMRLPRASWRTTFWWRESSGQTWPCGLVVCSVLKGSPLYGHSSDEFQIFCMALMNQR